MKRKKGGSGCFAVGKPSLLLCCLLCLSLVLLGAPNFLTFGCFSITSYFLLFLTDVAFRVPERLLATLLLGTGWMEMFSSRYLVWVTARGLTGSLSCGGAERGGAERGCCRSFLEQRFFFGMVVRRRRRRQLGRLAWWLLKRTGVCGGGGWGWLWGAVMMRSWESQWGDSFGMWLRRSIC